MSPGFPAGNRFEFAESQPSVAVDCEAEFLRLQSFYTLISHEEVPPQELTPYVPSLWLCSNQPVGAEAATTRH